METLMRNFEVKEGKKNLQTLSYLAIGIAYSQWPIPF
jgi:hypothetical protein